MQQMGELPVALTVPAPVFCHTALDLFGPVLTLGSGGRKRLKRWIVVFVCRTTTFVHLEMMESYSKESFKAAFIRFSSIYPLPKTIRSDRGTQIVGFQKSIGAFMLEMGVEWEYALAGVPATNGSAEAAVKLTKRQLGIMSRLKNLTDCDLQTLCRKSQMFVNTRPIGWREADEDLSTIRPFDFLDGALGRLPADVQQDEGMGLKERKDFMEKQFSYLWEKLQSDFFSERVRKNKNSRIKNLNVGNIVAVRELNAVRGRWSWGRVVNVHQSRDGVVRAADVKTRSSDGTMKVRLLGVSRLGLISAF